MSVPEKFFDLVLKWANSISRKIYLILIILVALIYCNNQFCWTYYYKLNRDVDVLQKLNSLIKQSDDSSVIKYAVQQKEYILNRKSYFDDLSLLNNSIIANTATNNNIRQIVPPGSGPKMSNILYVFLCSGFLSYASSIMSLFLIFYIKTSTRKKFIFAFLFVIPFALIGIFEFYFVRRMPPFFLNDYFYNYALYLIVNSLLSLSLVNLIGKTKYLKEFEDLINRKTTL